MRKKLLLMILAVVVIAGMTGAGTWAYFTDTEGSLGNTFAAGSLELKLRDSNESWRDGVTATWTLANMKPGDAKYGYVDVDTVGTIPGDHLEITCDYSVTEESLRAASDTDPGTDLNPDSMARNMVITYAHYQDGIADIDFLTGTDAVTMQTKDVWRIGDADGDGKITLCDLKADPVDDLPRPDGEQFTLKMWVRFSEAAGNDFQGDTFNLNVHFTLNQGANQ